MFPSGDRVFPADDYTPSFLWKWEVALKRTFSLAQVHHPLCTNVIHLYKVPRKQFENLHKGVPHAVGAPLSFPHCIQSLLEMPGGVGDYTSSGPAQNYKTFERRYVEFLKNVLITPFRSTWLFFSYTGLISPRKHTPPN